MAHDETPEQDEDEGEQFTARAEDLLELLVEAFKQYCEHNELDPADPPLSLSPARLLAWVETYGHMFGGWAGLRADAGTPEETVRFLRVLHEGGPEASLILLSLWPRVLLSHRAPPRHALASLTLMLLYRWHDGRATARTVEVVYGDGTETDFAWDDGAALAACHRTVAGLTRELRVKGLDGMLEGVNLRPGGRESWELFAALLQWFLHGLDDATLEQGAKSLGNNRPATELRPELESLIALAVRLIEPLPPLAKRSLLTVDDYEGGDGS